MKKDSSKEQMKDVFQLLNTIKKVEPSQQLFQKIEEKINVQKQNIIPAIWLRVAAVAFVFFISIEVYYVTDNTSVDDELSDVISTIDNTLYDE